MSSFNFEWTGDTLPQTPSVIASPADLAAKLRQLPLLPPEVKAAMPGIAAEYADLLEFTQELVRRRWLTPFQVDELLHGRGDDLLLGGYVLEAKLGEGGMGQVFKARHLKFNRTVALKLMRKEQLDSPNTVERFRREIRAAAKLGHPNVVLALDADQVGDKHFFTMEYVEGTDLGRMVKESGALPIRQACDYIRQAALGLQHAYEQGLIHRDIKPSNLLVSAKGEQVKILDMGLARVQRRDDSGNETAAGTITESGMVLGTPDFMAPEQTRDTHSVDIRADLYSLGCTLYYLLTGQVPFPDCVSIEKLLHHQLDEPVPVEAVRPEVPRGLAAVVRKLMAKKPAARYQTPGELAAVLEEGTRSGWPDPGPALAPTDGNAAHSPWTSIAKNASGGLARISKPAPSPLKRSSEQLKLVMQRQHWWPAAIAASVVLCAIVVGIIIYLANDYATLGVQTVDRSVKIEVLRGADLVRVIDPETEREVSLASGAYQLRLRSGPGLEIDTPSCMLARGGRYVVTVRRVAPPAKPKPKAAAAGSLDDSWVKRVATLPPEKQVNEVGYKLKELNPGYDLAGFHPRTDRGVVVELTLATDALTDLAPLRALPGLQSLSCQGTAANGAYNGRLADLTPLKDLRLTQFHCDYNPRLADLTPLRGQPLESLTCAYTDISDLSVLRGMPLKQLTITQTPISDLAPLQGLPLTDLACGGPGIADLSPLQGMPSLRQLQLVAPKVSSLVPLRGLHLTLLTLTAQAVTDLSPLQGMPLETLYVDNSSVSDLSPLAGMPLKDLRLTSTPVKDLLALKGMQLKTLLIAGTNVRDLSPLQGVPLDVLQLNNTGVSDLAPLAGMPLRDLQFAMTKVRDLSPLKGMPLQYLDCRTMLISNLSPLQELPLMALNCDYQPDRDAAVLRKIKTLQTINGVPAAEFLK